MTMKTKLSPKGFSLTPGPLDLCGKGTRIGYDGKGRARIVRFYCGRWDCPRCAPRQARMWTERIAAAAPYYYAYTVDWSDYPAATKKLRRSGADYWGIRQNGRCLILATADVLSAATMVSPGNGLEPLLDTYLVKEDLPLKGRRKVMRSHGFSCPTPSAVNWRWVTVEESPEEVAQKLEDLGCLVIWQGQDEADISYLSEEGKTALQALFGIGPGPPVFTVVTW